MNPPDGAGDVRFTVPVTLFPPVTVLLDTLTDATHGGGVIWMVAVAPVHPPTLAVIVAFALLDPALVDTLKLAEVCPAGTVMDATTCACALLLARFTTTPPGGAGEVNVTVPLKLAPPDTELD